MKRICLLLFLFSIHFSYSQSPLAKQWDYRFGGTGMDEPTSIQPTIDGGYILGGFISSGIGGDITQASWGAWDYWIVKIDFAGNLQFQKRFGGTLDDRLYALQQTTDGGYILGGWSSSGIGGDKTQASQGSYDYWIVKIDSLGNKQWDKDFGGTADDELYSLQQTSDGGYILGGMSASGIGGDKTQANWDATNTTPDYWIVKTDSLGNKQWDRRFGGTGNDILYSLQQTADHGYVLGGWSTSGISGDKTQASQGNTDFWVVKIDSVGNKQWDKRFGGTDYDQAYSVQQTTDKGYILGGITQSGIGGDKTQVYWGNTDYWVVKIDSVGNKQWDKDFGGTDMEDAFGNISQTLDGGYLMAGTSYSNISGNKTENNSPGGEQTWVVKTDSLGNKQWDKTILTPGHTEAGFTIQTKDGCYAMLNMDNGAVGYYKSQPDWNNSWDYWVVKFCDTTQTVLPHANFISSDTSFCNESGQCIDFTDLSTNNPSSWQWSFPGATPDTSTQQNPSNICYYAPGTYAVKLIVSNSNGSDSLTVSPMITFYNAATPPVLTLSGDTLFCSHASAYQWYLSGSPISGATDSFYVAASSGVYAVQITDGNGCSRLSNGFPVSVNELSSSGGIKIYPNPVKNELWVMCLGSWVGSQTMLEIDNVLGEKVLQSEIMNPKSEINVSSLAKGVYFVELTNREKVYRAKFVKD